MSSSWNNPTVSDNASSTTAKSKLSGAVEEGEIAPSSPSSSTTRPMEEGEIAPVHNISSTYRRRHGWERGGYASRDDGTLSGLSGDPRRRAPTPPTSSGKGGTDRGGASYPSRALDSSTERDATPVSGNKQQQHSDNSSDTASVGSGGHYGPHHHSGYRESRDRKAQRPGTASGNFSAAAPSELRRSRGSDSGFALLEGFADRGGSERTDRDRDRGAWGGHSRDWGSERERDGSVSSIGERGGDRNSAGGITSIKERDGNKRDSRDRDWDAPVSLRDREGLVSSSVIAGGGERGGPTWDRDRDSRATGGSGGVGSGSIARYERDRGEHRHDRDRDAGTVSSSGIPGAPARKQLQRGGSRDFGPRGGVVAGAGGSTSREPPFRDRERDSRDRDMMMIYGRSGGGTSASGVTDAASSRRKSVGSVQGGSISGLGGKYERRGGRERRSVTAGNLSAGDPASSRDYYGPAGVGASSSSLDGGGYNRDSTRRGSKGGPTSDSLSIYGPSRDRDSRDRDRDRPQSLSDSRGLNDLQSPRKKYSFTGAPGSDRDRDRDRDGWDSRPGIPYPTQSSDSGGDYTRDVPIIPHMPRFRPPPGVTTLTLGPKNEKRIPFSPPPGAQSDSHDDKKPPQDAMSPPSVTPQSISAQGKLPLFGRDDSQQPSPLDGSHSNHSFSSSKSKETSETNPCLETSPHNKGKNTLLSEDAAIPTDPAVLNAKDVSSFPSSQSNRDKSDLSSAVPTGTPSTVVGSSLISTQIPAITVRRSSVFTAPKTHIDGTDGRNLWKPETSNSDSVLAPSEPRHPNSLSQPEDSHFVSDSQQASTDGKKLFVPKSLLALIQRQKPHFSPPPSKESLLQRQRSDNSVERMRTHRPKSTENDLSSGQPLQKLPSPDKRFPSHKPNTSLQKTPVPATPTAPKISTAAIEQPVLDKKEKSISSQTVRTNTTLSPLTCASLGNTDKASMAEKAVNKLSEIVSKPSLNSILERESGSLLLPTKQQILKGISGLDLQIKTRQRESEKVKTEIKRAVQEEKLEEEREKVRQEEEKRKVDEVAKQEKAQKEYERKRDIEIHKASKLKQTEELRQKSTIEKRQREKDELVQLQRSIEKNCADAAAACLAAETLENQRKQRQKEKKTELELTKGDETEKIAAQYEAAIEKVKLDADEAKASWSLLNNTVNEIEAMLKLAADAAAEEKLQAGNLEESGEVIQSNSAAFDRATALMDSLKDDPQDMAALISTVLTENQRRARATHFESLSAIPYTPLSSDENLLTTPDGILPDQMSCTDDESEREIADWSNKTRQVTGLADALYTEPSENPYFAHHAEQHSAIKLVVREHIRGMKKKLFRRWKELGQEYHLRQSTYLENAVLNNDDSSDSSSQVDGFKDGGSSILGGKRKSSAGDFGSDFVSRRSNSNSYRRPRRNAGFGIAQSNMSGDIVRSEYEQEQIIAELTAKDAMEKRIAFGGSKLPRQRCKVEKELFVGFHDTQMTRFVSDPVCDEEERRNINPWTDVEKCVFLDRFLHHPKDFRKIATFLRNKTTKDCVQFYYDSKQSVPYKAALKEHLLRRKRRHDASRRGDLTRLSDATSWDATIEAATSVGAVITAGSSTERRLVFSLPSDDNTYYTRYFHPMNRELFDAVICEANDSDDETGISKKKFVGKLFAIDMSKRKFLRTISNDSGAGVKRKSCVGSDGESSVGSAKIPRSSSATSVHNDIAHIKIVDGDQSVGQVNGKPVGVKKTPQKWSEAEKSTFFETVEEHGKNWPILASAVGSKSISQIKNYYYDHKKQFGKVRMPSDKDQDMETDTQPEVTVESDKRALPSANEESTKTESGLVLVYTGESDLKPYKADVPDEAQRQASNDIQIQEVLDKYHSKCSPDESQTDRMTDKMQREAVTDQSQFKQVPDQPLQKVGTDHSHLNRVLDDSQMSRRSDQAELNRAADQMHFSQRLGDMQFGRRSGEGHFSHISDSSRLNQLLEDAQFRQRTDNTQFGRLQDTSQFHRALDESQFERVSAAYTPEMESTDRLPMQESALFRRSDERPDNENNLASTLREQRAAFSHAQWSQRHHDPLIMAAIRHQQQHSPQPQQHFHRFQQQHRLQQQQQHAQHEYSPHAQNDYGSRVQQEYNLHNQQEYNPRIQQEEYTPRAQQHTNLCLPQQPQHPHLSSPNPRHGVMQQTDGNAMQQPLPNLNSVLSPWLTPAQVAQVHAQAIAMQQHQQQETSSMSGQRGTGREWAEGTPMSPHQNVNMAMALRRTSLNRHGGYPMSQSPHAGHLAISGLGLGSGIGDNNERAGPQQQQQRQIQMISNMPRNGPGRHVQGVDKNEQNDGVSLLARLAADANRSSQDPGQR